MVFVIPARTIRCVCIPAFPHSATGSTTTENITVYPIHSQFIYDRNSPWAGAQVGWLYNLFGWNSIHRGKADHGLVIVCNLFANSSLPMAAAPEGATNGHNEMCPLASA